MRHHNALITLYFLNELILGKLYFNSAIRLSMYRVEKQNLQVAKLVNFEHVNENMVKNSSPTFKHNLFELIQSKKFLVFGFGHVGICKKAQ